MREFPKSEVIMLYGNTLTASERHLGTLQRDIRILSRLPYRYPSHELVRHSHKHKITQGLT
jgi:hypothetical protein